MTVAPEQGGSPAIGGACSLRPWWHAGEPPARFPTAPAPLVGRGGGLSAMGRALAQRGTVRTIEGYGCRLQTELTALLV